MSKAKESREQVIASGSPLRRHSLNQANLQTSNELERKLRNAFPKQVSTKEEIQARDLIAELKEENLPLSENFLEIMLPFMIETAARRSADEQKRDLTIPQRAAN